MKAASVGVTRTRSPVVILTFMVPALAINPVNILKFPYKAEEMFGQIFATSWLRVISVVVVDAALLWAANAKTPAK